MNADQVIEGIGKAVAATNPPQEYCFLWIDWWPMCMTKSEWSGWMQAIGVLATLFILLANFFLDRYRSKQEKISKIRAESQAIKYYLQKHQDFTASIDVYTITFKLFLSDYENSKNNGDRDSVVKAINCFEFTEHYYRDLFDAFDKLKFHDREDLHNNRYAESMEAISSSIRSLKYIYDRYEYSKPQLDKLSAGIADFSEHDMEIYLQRLNLSHQEWVTYADAVAPYYIALANGWKEISKGVIAK